MEKETVRVIDWSVYGALLRNRRVKAGFKSMNDFIEALWLRTRVKVSRDTMYKIEQGKVPPSIELYWGINIVLFGTRDDDFLIKMAVCDDWEEVEEYYGDYNFKDYEFNLSRPYVSEKWASENRKEISNFAFENDLVLDFKDGMGVPVFPDQMLTPEECSEITNEPIPVFECIHGLSLEP